jgi:predicted permease
MDWLKRDLRLGLRHLLRDKGFSVTVAITLALCIGANTALFSVVHHVLLRPLPVSEPERLLMMGNDYPKAGAGGGTESGVPDYYDRLRETSVFEEQSMSHEASVSLDEDGLPTRIRALSATPSFFRMMRVTPQLGRYFSEDEGEVGNEKKVVLSDGFWRKHFGGDPGVVGRDLRLDGQPYVVVGVMPRSFQAMAPGVAVFRPFAFTPEQKADSERHSNNYENLGRLKAGASLEQAQAQIDALNAANFERFPQYKEVLKNAGFRTVVVRYPDYLVRTVKATLYLLWGGALFVLLIGCVNVANLVLGRARTRQKELATRLALGAAPWQVARSLVIETLLLSLVAAAAGLLVSALALGSFSSFDLTNLPYGSEVRLDGAAALYAVALSLLIGFVMGLLPVATVLPANLTAVLREEGRSSTGGHGARSLRRTLVVAQVAFTFVLLLGAGLLLASFRRVLEVDPGFVAERVLTASLVLPRTRYAEDDRVGNFTDEALRRVRALPGVLKAGATSLIPLGDRSNDSVILAEGYAMQPGESVISPYNVCVTPGYFESMGVRLIQGRFFQESDAATAPRVAIVDERLARRFWHDQDPIGRRMYKPEDINDLFAVTDKTVFYTVVGVIRDLKLRDLTEGQKTVGAYYFPMAQDPSHAITLAVKTDATGDSLPNGLRGAIAALDPELPLFDVASMEQRTAKSLLNRRSPALLALAFGVLALLLSAVGIYGVLAYLVTQRTKEIGIRIALGSSARGIFDLVIREGLLLVGTGLLIGSLGAFLLRGSLESQLFGIRAADPMAIFGVTLLLGLVALVACAVPARRATRIDPRVALTE